MSEFGRSIDELEGDLFHSLSGGGSVQSLSQGDDSLSGTLDGTLDHDEVLVDDTIVREASHGGDALFSKIRFSGSGFRSVSNSVDLEVGNGSLVVTSLTSSSNGPRNFSRVPSSDTSNFSETFVCLSGQFSGSPSSSNTFKSVTFSNTNNVDNFGFVEDGRDRNLLFEERDSVVNLLFNSSSVNLDFDDVGLLLSFLEESVLGVGNKSNNGGVFLDSSQFSVHGIFGFSSLFDVFGEGFLLGLVPVLVESSSNVVAQVTSPDSGKSSQSLGSGNVTNNSNSDHGRGFDDGDGFDNFLLVHLGAEFVQFSNNVSHTSLESHKGSQMARFGGIILGEGLNSSSVRSASLSGTETQRTSSRSSKFSVRH